MGDLLPCPWCGKATSLGYDAMQEAIMCFDCMCAGPERYSEAEAIAAWNSRALPSATQVVVRVKPLEWQDGRFSDTSERFTAETPFGTYEAMRWSDGTFGGTMLDGVEFGDLDSLEAAKAAAQIDYEARVLAALEPTAFAPLPPAPEASAQREEARKG